MIQIPTPSGPVESASQAVLPPTGLTGLNTYDRARSIYNLQPSQIAPTRAAMARARCAGGGIARIGCIGDSITSGEVVNPGTQSYPLVLRNALQKRGLTLSGTGSVMMVNGAQTPTDSRLAYSGTWGTNSQGFSQYAVGTGAVVFTSDEAGTQAIITYIDCNAQWEYQIDGSAAVVVNPGSSYAIEQIKVSGLANTTHTITITNTTGGATSAILCLEVGSPTEGISVTNLGIPGNTAANWLATNNIFYALPSVRPAVGGRCVNRDPT